MGMHPPYGTESSSAVCLVSQLWVVARWGVQLATSCTCIIKVGSYHVCMYCIYMAHNSVSLAAYSQFLAHLVVFKPSRLTGQY